MSTRSPVTEGDVLGGKYRVDRVLGRGGMGLVVAVTHLELGEQRAIKLLIDASANPDTVSRFLREAKAAAKLKSQHAIKVHDVGRFEDGEPFIVMEYLEGYDLGELCKQRGALPPGEAVDYLLQSLEAIAEAHAAGIVHRDLKPANLFLTRDASGRRTIKVLDFGISKLLEVGQAQTGTSEVFGTPHYMSPEQLRSTREVDGRADIWALGVILHQFVTGACPFQANTLAELCISVMYDPPPLPSSMGVHLPAGLDEVVSRCLQKLPEDRYDTVAGLADALLPFATHEHAAQLVDSIRRISSDEKPPSLAAPPVGAALPTSATTLAAVRTVAATPAPQQAAETYPMRHMSPQQTPQAASAATTQPAQGPFDPTTQLSAHVQPRSEPVKRWPLALVSGLAIGLAVAVGVLLSRPTPTPIATPAATLAATGGHATAQASTGASSSSVSELTASSLASAALTSSSTAPPATAPVVTKTPPRLHTATKAKVPTRTAGPLVDDL